MYTYIYPTKLLHCRTFFPTLTIISNPGDNYLGIFLLDKSMQHAKAKTYSPIKMDLVSVFFFKKNVFFKEDLCIIKKTEEDNRYAELDIEKIYVKYMCKNK